MSELDKAAMLDATEQFMASVVGSGFDCDALEAAITAYRQAECKPFKDAPRDGTVIEAYFVKNLWNHPKWRPAWRSDQNGWVTVEYSTILVNDVRCWKEVSSERVFGDGHCFTHYRIPFNPEEG